jgi:hypothetical protein
MSNATWSFAYFVRWLRTKSESLRASGATVELDVHESHRASARLRVESGKRLGELTVWDDGSAHMAVIDLQSGDFVFERDGVSLAEAPSPPSALNEFFEQLEAGA